jgi:membrane-bound metal-dependent hydrolase YbcI (DUF457 family)
MDPISHALISGLAAKTAKVTPRRTLVMYLLGLFPDFDVIFNLTGSWSSLLQHRGLTHSLLGMVIQPLLFSWLLRNWDLGSFRIRTFHYFIPIALHIVCDLLTSYGVPLLSPIHTDQYSWSLLGSVNIVPTLFTIGVLYWMEKRDLHGWRNTAPMWAVWCLYIFIMFSGKFYGAKFSEAKPDMTIVPSIFNPFSWNAVDVNQTERSYDSYHINMWTGKLTPEGRVPMPAIDFPVQSSMASPNVQRLLKQSRWPVTRTVALDNGWRVDWGHIAFSVRGLVRGGVSVTIDAAGKIIDDQVVVLFWEPEKIS